MDQFQAQTATQVPRDPSIFLAPLGFGDTQIFTLGFPTDWQIASVVSTFGTASLIDPATVQLTLTGPGPGVFTLTLTLTNGNVVPVDIESLPLS